MTFDVSQFLKGAQDRATRTVLLAPDPDAVATAQQVAATAGEGGTLSDVVDPDDVAAARAAASSSAWAFTVGTVGRSVWQQLIDAHPPSKRQQEIASAQGTALAWDMEAFPQAAIAACLREAKNPDGDVLTFDAPRVDRDGDVVADPQATELTSGVWTSFPLGDTARLWAAVVELNVAAPSTAKLASFGTGSPQTRPGVR